MENEGEIWNWLDVQKEDLTRGESSALIYRLGDIYETRGQSSFQVPGEMNMYYGNCAAPLIYCFKFTLLLVH